MTHAVARLAVIAPVVALLAALAPAVAPLPAQSYFGQNQVQYDDFDWKVLETEHFQIHFYPAVEQTAKIAASLAERTYARLSRVLGHEFREKKPIVLFASRTDFAQNNIFGDLGESTGGVTDWLRQRNTLYFMGDYGELEHILAHEMVHVFQYDIFSRGQAGANFQALARVAPPGWFMEGMAEYLSVGPDHPATNSVIRDAALNGRVPTVEQMTLRESQFFPYRYGAALWEYVGSRWGDAVIGDIMNATPSVGLERAFRRELGVTLEELGEEWREAMQVKHLPQIAERERARRFADPLLTQRRTGGFVPVYVAPSLSPDGERIAYLSTGSFLRAEVFLDLYIASTKDGKRLQRLTKSVLNPETEELRSGYSQSAFSPDGKLIAYTAQRQGKDVIDVVDARGRRVHALDGLPFEQMIGPTFSPDGRRLAFIGTTGEQSDLWVVDLDGGNLRQLTNDLYGDAQPSWSPDGRWIAFASERGPQTDFELLRFGKWRISVLDVESGRVEVLPNQDGRNLNPQWSPDSRSIAYVSDRTGIQNLFLYELAEREHYQLTDVFSGIASFTEWSPAISWARSADKLAFVYFEDDNYSVWWISNPRRLKGEPYRAPPPTMVAAAGARRDTSAALATVEVSPFATPAPRATPSTTDTPATPDAPATPDSVARPAADTVPPPTPRSVLLDSVPEQLSVYRSPVGLRRSEVLRGQELVPTGLTVAALLDSVSLALPDTSTFRIYDYKTAFTPEYVSQPSIGYAQDNFGRGVFGGTTIVLADLLGNQRLAFAGAINGRISEAQIFAAYANFSNRVQYLISASQAPYFLFGGGGYAPDPESGAFSERFDLRRLIWREVGATALLPRDRFTRWEFGARLQHVSQATLTIRRLVDPVTFRPLSLWKYDPITDGEGAFMFSPYAAYVSDNTLMGYTAPILGRRYRFQVAPTVGQWRFTEFLVDYRRYDPILFNFLTVATRVQGLARVGPGESRFPPEALRPEFIRGYDQELLQGNSCVGEDERQCVSYDELIGSRVAFANAELRFPLVRRVDLGVLPISLPPVDGHVFYDAGVAWSSGQQVVFARTASGDPDERAILSSWGAGFRLNLFGFAILRMDYVIPLDSPDRKPRWSWLLGGYGF